MTTWIINFQLTTYGGLVTHRCGDESAHHWFWWYRLRPCIYLNLVHYSNVIMSAMASQMTGVSIACSAVCSDTDQRKHQSSSSLAFERGIHRWSVDSPHKGPVTRKMFPFDDVLMWFIVNRITKNNRNFNWNWKMYFKKIQSTMSSARCRSFFPVPLC